MVAIVGRNGVGKTTLLRALAGLQKYEGTIAMHEAPTTPDVEPRPFLQSPDQTVRPSLGMVFQNADLQLFRATVRDEVLYRVFDPDMRFCGWLLEALGIARYEESPPLLLSEGEKKRVALATVLMHRPRHGLLLDEPSLGQDAAHKAILIRLARALAEAGQLVILTTHDLPLAAQADRLMLLGSDGFVADGPPAEILRAHSAWAQIGLAVPTWVLGPDPRPTEEQELAAAAGYPPGTATASMSVTINSKGAAGNLAAQKTGPGT